MDSRCPMCGAEKLVLHPRTKCVQCYSCWTEFEFNGLSALEPLGYLISSKIVNFNTEKTYRFIDLE